MQCLNSWPGPHPAYRLLTAAWAAALLEAPRVVSLYSLLQLFGQAYSYLFASTQTLSCDLAVFLNSLVNF